jgi:CheY-like chemotaxis protein/predicted transcriptional regulator
VPVAAGSFSFIVVKRILSALEHEGPTKKTNLAVSSRLNYNVCLKYINMLELLGWISITQDKWTFITITELGKQVNEKLIHYSDSDNGMTFGGQENDSNDVPIGTPLKASLRNQTERFDKLKEQPPANKASSGVMGNVMLVDDEPDIVLTYRSFLALKGYNVEGFSDPFLALQKVASSKAPRFDLIILDIRMPGINGLQLYQSLKIMSPSSKFLFVSSLDAARELVTLLPGISQEQVLQKPINKDYFVKRVEFVLTKLSA